MGSESADACWNTVATDINQSDGRDFLIYSGHGLDYEGPLPSMRLKAIRRGLFDYEYAAKASRFVGEERVDEILRNYMTNNPEDWYMARKALGAIILENMLK